MSITSSTPPVLPKRRNPFVCVLAILGFSVVLLCVALFSQIGWTKEKRNFWWALDFKCPRDVEIVHSFFPDEPDPRDEYYYFELKPAEGSQILKTLIAEKVLVTEGFVVPGLFDSDVTFPLVPLPESRRDRFRLTVPIGSHRSPSPSMRNGVRLTTICVMSCATSRLGQYLFALRKTFRLFFAAELFSDKKLFPDSPRP